MCIARLPRHQSIAWPGSRCPQCHAPIRAWDNIPLLSFLLLRGACRSCRKRISIRYPLVEAALAGLFLLCALRFHTPAPLGESCVLSFLLLGLFVMDLEIFRLPDAFTLPGIALGALQCALPGGGLASELALARNAPYPLPSLPPLVGSALGAAGAAGLLLLIRWLYSVVRKREGMGLGDVKLAALLGAWLGVAGAGLTLMLGVLLAAFAGVLASVALRRPAGALRLPLGSFLCAGGLLTLFTGSYILKWYFSFWR